MSARIRLIFVYADSGGRTKLRAAGWRKSPVCSEWWYIRHVSEIKRDSGYLRSEVTRHVKRVTLEQKLKESDEQWEKGGNGTNKPN
jgi:hypothetical protein